VEVSYRDDRELEADQASTTIDGSPTQVRIWSKGTHANDPTVQANLLSIAREALLNAFCHARAKSVELDIDYSQRILLLRYATTVSAWIQSS